MHSRFANDGRPTLELTPRQLETKRSIDAKIARGHYRFESVPCPICGGDDLERIAEKDRCGLYAPVSVCRTCGLVQTNPRMTQASFEEYYNVEHRGLQHGDTGPRDAFDHEVRRGKQIAAFLDAAGVALHGRRVLEVGCGAGGILHVLRERGAIVVGYDLNEEYVRWGREHYHLDLRAGARAQVERVDLIVYSHVLEHLADPREELVRARSELLAPGGAIYVEVPGIKRLDAYEDDLLRYLQSAHIYHFSLRTLDNLVAVAGYTLAHGDELARGLLRPSSEPREWQNDHADVMASLREAEQRRRVTWKQRVRRALHRTGLLGVARRVRRELQRHVR